jgi:hypothetical protein
MQKTALRIVDGGDVCRTSIGFEHKTAGVATVHTILSFLRARRQRRDSCLAGPGMLPRQCSGRAILVLYTLYISDLSASHVHLRDHNSWPWADADRWQNFISKAQRIHVDQWTADRTDSSISSLRAVYASPNGQADFYRRRLCLSAPWQQTAAGRPTGRTDGHIHRNEILCWD